MNEYTPLWISLAGLALCVLTIAVAAVIEARR